MAWTICFPIDKDHITVDGRKKICITIPLLIPVDFKLPPEPPQPPFLIHDKIDPKEANVLQTLATVYKISEMLPNEFSHEIQKTVTNHMNNFASRLGKGVNISNHQNTKLAAE